MNCNECQEFISDYVDGELDLGAQTKMEHHLANCEPCRAVRDDLLQIVHFSRQLPLHVPSAVVWTRIQEQIVDEQPKTFGARAKSWWARLQMRDFSLSVPQMIAVSAVFVVMITVGAILFKNNQNVNPQFAVSPVAGGNGNVEILSSKEALRIQQMEQRINELKDTIAQRKASWSPDLQLSFDKNMIYVDQLLAECRQELNNNPTDETCRELLDNAYEEKMRVLEGFVDFQTN